MAERGKFFVIEGTDGSGKATQLHKLHERLEKAGKPVATFDFPQYQETFFGALVGRYLNGEFGTNAQVSPYLATVLYAADRWEAKDGIEQALVSGKIVLSNRYVLSSLGHQVPKVPAEKQADLQKHILTMEYEVFGIPREDLNIFLYVPADVAQKLVDQKGERPHLDTKRDIHEADLDHLKKSLKMYKWLAEIQPDRVVMVNCTEGGNLLAIEEIAEAIWEVVETKL